MKVVDDSTKVVFNLCQREEIGTEETEMPSPYIVFTDQVVRVLRKMGIPACSSAFNYKISMHASTLKLMRLTHFNEHLGICVFAYVEATFACMTRFKTLLSRRSVMCKAPNKS